MRTPGDTYFRHRFPDLIIAEAVWLYYTFSLSTDEVALLLLQRGVTVSGESIRRWTRKFGPDFARRIKRRRPQVGDTWHLDELVATINGIEHHVWRGLGTLSSYRSQAGTTSCIASQRESTTSSTAET